MIIYYLYKKTHRKTGLQYLGQTKKNPFAYEGSGVDWTTHIAQHGYDVDTEILLETTDKEKMKKVGRYYSNLWNIVEDPTWANRIPETGGGPGGIIGRNRGEEFSKKCVINNTGKNNPSYGVYWWTNGTSEIKSKICPGPEWKWGRFMLEDHKQKFNYRPINGYKNPSYGKYWWTNGIDSVKSDRCPEGYYRGVGTIQRAKSRNKKVKGYSET